MCISFGRRRAYQSGSKQYNKLMFCTKRWSWEKILMLVKNTKQTHASGDLSYAQFFFRSDFISKPLIPKGNLCNMWQSGLDCFGCCWKQIFLAKAKLLPHPKVTFCPRRGRQKKDNGRQAGTSSRKATLHAGCARGWVQIASSYSVHPIEDARGWGRDRITEKQAMCFPLFATMLIQLLTTTAEKVFPLMLPVLHWPRPLPDESHHSSDFKGCAVKLLPSSPSQSN